MATCTVSDIYRECCALYGVKPNRDILEQISLPNFFTIREIDASRTFLGEFGVRALLEFVRCHAGIRRLLLVKNGVDTTCVEHLCSVLRESPSLSFVDLSENTMSTLSVRLLWETARSVPTVREIKVDKCGIDNEWTCRLNRCCAANEELQRLGFYSYGRERSLWSWEMVLILVLGPEDLVQKYCAEVLPPVCSFLLRLRLRVAPLTIEEGDTCDIVKSKVLQCKSTFNYSRSWCVALINGLEKWRDADVSALMEVLRQEAPNVWQLRNKFGELRDPVYRCAQNLFVYTLTDLSGSESLEQNGRGVVTTVSPSVWLSAIGAEMPDAVSVPFATAMGGENRWKLRCQTDLSTALHTVYSEPPRSMTLETDNREEEIGQKMLDEQVWEIIEKEKHVGSLHPKCKDIMLHVESQTGLISVPLILYGSGVFDKSKLLSWVAASYSAMESFRVVPYYVSHENQSLVEFLYYLLRVFSRKVKGTYHSAEELSTAVREAICNYDGVVVLLLVSCIDLLNHFASQHSLILEWLPSNLPSTVRVIMSLNTESPLLAMLRKRMPQPYEMLIMPLPRQIRAELFLKKYLERNVEEKMAERNLKSSGKVCDGFAPPESTKAIESAFLQKDGAESTSFATFTVSILQRMPVDLAKRDLVFLLANEVPDSLDELLTLLLRQYEVLSDPVTVQYLTLCLTAAPLPISEITYICEELGPCPRRKTLPILFLMSDDGLLTVTSDSTVHLSGTDVRRVVLSLYADMQDSVSVLVETHLYRLVKTQSPDMSFCFRHLVPLMIANGSFDEAYSLVLNPTVIDALLSHKLENRIYVIDLIFSLLNARRLLLELGGDFSFPLKQSIHHIKHQALRSALKTVQSSNAFFFQAALLASDASPYHVQAVRATQVPYTVLLPLNRGDEDGAAHSLECNDLPIHCHLLREYLAVTTTQEVTVYSINDFQKVVARYYMPLESTQNLCGALIATESRVVVIGDSQLLLWDFVGQSFTLFEDTISSLNENALDSFHLNLVVRHSSSERISIINVLKKKVVSELQPTEVPVRDALFTGNGILALAVYDLLLLREDEKEVVKFPHNGVISCFGFCNDSSLIASCVKEDIWIWSGAGELLHFINAGLTPLEGICFNASGNLLLSRQSEGLKLWHPLSGKRITTLESCLDEDVAFACFTNDDLSILGRCSSHVCVWDVHTHQPIGALVSDVGQLTFIQERNQMVIGATSKNQVKIWKLHDAPIPSIQMVKEKSITTMWRKNAKLSYHSIVRLEINSHGTLIAFLDESGTLMFQPMNGASRLACNIGNVQSFMFFGDMVFFTLRGESNRFFSKSLSDDAAAVEFVLPRGIRVGAKLDLINAEDRRSIAVISNSDESSIIYTYNTSDWTLTNQFLGHSGPIVHAFFAGEFLFSSGSDCTLRLWSLVRHAERTSYVHDCPVTAAAAGSSMTFFFIDDRLRLFHVHVKNIVSAAHAHFVVDTVELTLTIPTTFSIRHMILTSDLVLMSAEDGSVYLVDLCQGGAVSRLFGYKCCCIASTLEGADTVIVTGHSTGEVVLHHVRFAERM